MTTDKPRVLIASPVHQRPAILTRFLTSLSRFECDSLVYEFCFIDENEDPASSALLHSFAANRSNVIIRAAFSKGSYVCDETTHYWKEELIWKVAEHSLPYLNR